MLEDRRYSGAEAFDRGIVWIVVRDAPCWHNVALTSLQMCQRAVVVDGVILQLSSESGLRPSIRDEWEDL